MAASNTLDSSVFMMCVYVLAISWLLAGYQLAMAQIQFTLRYSHILPYP